MVLFPFSADVLRSVSGSLVRHGYCVVFHRDKVQIGIADILESHPRERNARPGSPATRFCCWGGRPGSPATRCCCWGGRVGHSSYGSRMQGPQWDKGGPPVPGEPFFLFSFKKP